MSDALYDFLIYAYFLGNICYWIVFAIVIVIFAPLSLFRATRDVAGMGIYISSYLLGITVWIICANITFVTWGWVALLVGVLLLGIGVVPLAILAAFFSMNAPVLAILLMCMCALVFVTRSVGMWLMRVSRGI